MGYEQLFCGARTRSGGRCLRYPLEGKRRCKLHGGASTGPRTPEGRDNSLSTLTNGHQQWYERMKERGYLFRGGWPKGMPRCLDRIIAKARELIASRKHERAARKE